MNFELFCRAMGLNPATMTDQERSHWQKIYENCDTRNAQIEKDAFCRVFKVGPKSFNKEARAVTAAVLTDAPTWMYDWERGWIQEILPMETCRIPAQMPLCDTHNTSTIKAQLGSCRNIRAENVKGQGQLVADLVFARDPDSQNAMEKVEDGHVTDMSGGYRIYASAYVEEGETYTLKGKTYIGPVKVALDWEPSEGSVCPIGADVFSKVRAKSAEQPAKTNGTTSAQSAAATSQRSSDENSQEAKAMKKTFDQFCRNMGIDAAALTDAQRSMLEMIFDAQCKELAADAEIPADAKERAAKVMKSTKEAEERGARVELERQSEIRSMCSVPGAEALADKLINDKVGIEDARKQVLEHLRSSRAPISTPKSTIEGGETSGEKLVRAATHGLAMRHNIKVENPAAGANEFRGRSLMRVVEECLHAIGVNTRSLSDDEMIQRAMASGDFPNILSNVANLQLKMAYENSEETWRDIVEINNDVSDFKVMTVANFGGVPVFSEVLEGGGYKAVDFRENGATNQVKTYGCEAKMTRQMIVNDQLGAFLRAIELFGVGADKLIGNGVWGIITTNPSISTLGNGTSNALFSVAHGNLIENASALGNDGVAALRLKLRQMKGLKTTDTMNLRLARIAVPSELEEQARVLTENALMVVDGVGVKNTAFGLQLTVEDRLSANSTVDYYGFASRPIIQVAFLNGQQRPEIVRLNSRNPDMFEVMARVDVGWAPIEHRYAVKADV